MKSIILPSALAAMAMLVASCGSGNSSVQGSASDSPLSEALANAPTTAQKVPLGDDSIIVAKLTSKPENITLPASSMLDDLKLVKLENSDDALVSIYDMLWVTENRIFARTDDGVKQFDLSGKYLGKVGAKGQGPGEYISPYYITSDEDGNIYIMEYNATAIHTYDSNGKFIEDIPLAQQARKGFLTLDNANGTVTVGALQFYVDEGATPVWVQDRKGNMISNVGRSDLTVVPDFSNEVNIGATSGAQGFSYSQFKIIPETDSIYEYSTGKFVPVFTFDFGEEVPMHQLRAFPQFFAVITYGEPEQVTESSYIIPANQPFIIDRKTLKGAPANLMLDDFGTLTISNYWTSCPSAEYFAWNLDPGDLLTLIEKAPQNHPLATKEGLKKMQELKESIDPNDNNYVFIGRWKK